MNWLDLIIIIYFIYFLVTGYLKGFLRQFFDLVVILLAFILAFKFYQPLGSFIAAHSIIQINFAKVFAFFIIWFIVELSSYIIYVVFYEKIPEKVRNSKYIKYSGVAPAFIRGLISFWVILGLISLLPLPLNYRMLIQNSALSKPVLRSSSLIEKYIGNVFGDAIDETINFLIIKPQSDEKIDLGFSTNNVSIDNVSEEKMLELINKERTSRGLKPLVMDLKLREVARTHSKDMFARGYFAHNNLDGKTPFDRMDMAGIQYMIAGENLALAPNVDVAHKGLMDSPGHKANILTRDFGKVGIGVIDGGKYGKMFSQEFTD